MIGREEFVKFKNAIKNRIFLIVGRCLLNAVDNSGKTQRLKVQGLGDEVISKMERLQEYGLETYPNDTGNDEVVALFLAGNRSKGVAVTVHNRELRPTDLLPGDVCLYAKDPSGSNTTRITLNSATGDIDIDAAAGSKVNINGATKSFVTHAELNSALQTLVGVIQSHIHITTATVGLGAPGTISPTASSITIDISAAETTTVKTGG